MKLASSTSISLCNTAWSSILSLNLLRRKKGSSSFTSKVFRGVKKLTAQRSTNQQRHAMRFFNLPFANPFLKGLAEAPLLLVLNTKDCSIHNDTFWPTLAIIGWSGFKTRSRARRSDTANSTISNVENCLNEEVQVRTMKKILISWICHDLPMARLDTPH